MKIGHAKHVCALIIVLTLSASIILVPSVSALNFSYTDISSFDLSISSSVSTVKAGDLPIFTVTLTLNSFLNGNAHVKIWLYNAASTAVDLVNQDLMASKNWTVGTSFNQPYSVSIPSSLSNNNYIYATIDVGAKHFSNIILAEVQNPTYSQLQSQIVQLQSNVLDLNTQLSALQANSTNIQNQLSALQSSYNNLQNNNTSLQSQIVNLSSEKASLQTQLTNLQTELNTLNAANTDLQSQIDTLLGNKTSLQSQILTLQNEKQDLLNQTNTMQNRITQLQLNNTNLQMLVNNFDEQITSLQSDLTKAQDNNNTSTVLMYIALVIAFVFIITTVYIILLVLKKKKIEAPKEEAEPQLY
jgi:predicted  nucleic acid-binding Zn-ribbon protein